LYSIGYENPKYKFKKMLSVVWCWRHTWFLALKNLTHICRVWEESNQK
jgi:hypothetical protein